MAKAFKQLYPTDPGSAINDLADKLMPAVTWKYRAYHIPLDKTRSIFGISDPSKGTRARKPRAGG